MSNLITKLPLMLMDKKHQESNELWLQEQVEELKKLLETSRIELKGHLKKLFPPTVKGFVAEGAPEKEAQKTWPR